jgi:hypothetical protein
MSIYICWNLKSPGDIVHYKLIRLLSFNLHCLIVLGAKFGFSWRFACINVVWVWITKYRLQNIKHHCSLVMLQLEE